jgi:putative ABC transport system permease protein
MIAPRWWKVIRDLWDNKSRTLLVILSIAIGVFAFGGLFIARVIGADDLNGQYRQINSPNIVMSLPSFDEHFVRWMARQAYISGAQGRASYSAKLVERAKTHNLTLLAYDNFEAIDIGRITPQAGTWPPGNAEIFLERSSLPLTTLKIGDPVIVEMVDGQRYTLTLAGTLHDLNTIPGTIQSQVTGYVSFRTLNRLELPARFNQIQVTIDPNYLAEQSQPVLDTLSQIANDLQRELQRNGTRVGSVRVYESDRHWASDIMGGIGTILIIVGLGALLLSGFLVVNTISGLLMQQKRQIGIMKVIGASRPQIIGIYMVMVAFLGVAALIIAIPSSLALAHILLFSVMSNFLNFDIQNFHLPTDIFLLQVVVAILSPMLSALVPILNGTSMTAAAAISDYASQRGSGLLEVALAQIRGLSRPILLSLRNTFRRKARLLMTLITLTAAGTLFMSIINVQTGLMLDINDRLRMANYDVQIALNGLYDREGLERRLEQMPGISQVEGWAQTAVQRIRPNGSKGGTFVIYGLPYNSIFIDPPLQTGQWLEAPQRIGQNDIVISTELLEDEPDIRIGDSITLDLNGEDEDWRVVGVLISASPVAYVHYDDLAHFMKMSGRASLMLVRTASRDEAFQNGVADELLTYFDLRNMGVGRSTTRAQLIADSVGGFDILISVLIGMAIIVAAVGGLGLAGTMSLNVLERTREIGVMRAVGASTGTIRQLFIVEAVLIGILSAVIALPLSVPGSIGFGNILGEVLANRPLPYAPTIEGPLLWFAIIIGISAAASVMPAQRASQISVREALAYE